MTDEDTPLSGNVLLNDTDPDPADVLRATLVTGPSNGTLVLNIGGSFVHTPNPDFNSSDSFVYRADDGALGSTATVQITVNPVDEPISTRPLAAGGEHACALDHDGDAFCWRRNGSGQLGNGTSRPRSPSPV